METERLNIYKQ